MFQVLSFLFGVVLITGLEGEEVAPFLLSSEMPKTSCASLEKLSTFSFVFSVRIEKNNVEEITGFFNENLKKIGMVTKKEIFTREGMDLASFSHPSLRFTLEQVVDLEGKKMPVLKASLSLNAVTKVLKNEVLSSVTTNTWIVYLNQEKYTPLSAIKAAFPSLIEAFYADFKKVNKEEGRPHFIIAYDPSFWEKNL